MTRDDIIRMAREANRYADTHADSTDCDWPLIRDERFAALVVAQEREACAQEIESWGPQRYVDDLVAAIRARGQA